MTKEQIQLIVSGASKSAPVPETTDSAAGTFADDTIGHLRGIGRAVVELRALVQGGVFSAAFDGLIGEGDQLEALTKRIGLAAEELQILRRAMALGDSVGQVLGAVPDTLTGRADDPQASRSAGSEALQSLRLTLDHLAALSPDGARLRASRGAGKVADQVAESALAPGMSGPSDPSPVPAPDVAGSDVGALPGTRRHGGQAPPDGQIHEFGELSLATPGLNAAIKGVLFDALASRAELVSLALADLVKPLETDVTGASSVASPRSLGGLDQVGDSRAAPVSSPPFPADHPIGKSAEPVIAEARDGLRRFVAELDRAAAEAAQVAAEAWNALLKPAVRLDKGTKGGHTDQRRAASVEQDGPIPTPRNPKQGIDTAAVEGGHGVHAQIDAPGASDASTDTMAEFGGFALTPEAALAAIAARVAALLSGTSRAAGFPLAGVAANRTTDQGSALPAAASMASSINGRRSSRRLPDLALPDLPAAPGSSAGGLPAIAADIAAIKANTARMAEQGIL